MNLSPFLTQATDLLEDSGVGDFLGDTEDVIDKASTLFGKVFGQSDDPAPQSVPAQPAHAVAAPMAALPDINQWSTTSKLLAGAGVCLGLLVLIGRR